jgi:hypothetical protein
VVEVRSIGRHEFNRLYPYTGELTSFIGEGAEWFANDARSVVGIVARRAAQPAWKYAVLKRSGFGDFRVWHVGEASGDLQTTRDECRRAMTAVESAVEIDAKARSASQKEPLQYFPQPNKGSPLVVLMILAGDIITITFVLLWRFRWR